MTKIVINTTSCVMGGGVQVADGLIRTLHACERPADEKWFIALSRPVYESVRDVLSGKHPFEVFEEKPGKILAGRRARTRLLEYEAEVGADAVLTVFGPSYVKFKSPEIMGFANPFMTEAGFRHYSNHPLGRILVSVLKKYLRTIHFRNAAALWVETEVARQGAAKLLGMPLSRIKVFPNSLNPALRQYSVHDGKARNEVIFISAAYWHKNHIALARAAKYMEADPNLPADWKFVFTVGEESQAWQLARKEFERHGLLNRVKNVGPVSIRDCPALYSGALALAHPSLLEVFSASYLEAMWFELPIAASDRPFAREVCGDAAVYFDPLDPKDIASALGRVMIDGALRQELVNKGKARLSTFPTPEAKNRGLIDFALEVARGRI